MTAVRALGEAGLIARLLLLLRRRRRGAHRTGLVEVGIGDDAAVLRAPRSARFARSTRWLFASDMLVEGVHFQRRRTPARWIGWKALAVNVSDIAAMGGRPLAAVVSLGIPPTTSVRLVDALYGGLNRCARRFGVAIVGGDTVRAPRVVIDIAILGTVNRKHLTLRGGARAGDALFVTGRLGGSLRSGRHARFTPRLREAQWLVRHVPIHAMIDLSDGLASDAWQVARASRMTLRLDAGRIPVSRAGRTLHHALYDGEDFELLFAVPRRAAARVPRRIGACAVSPVGLVVRRGARVELEGTDGRRSLVTMKGFRHF